MHSVEIYQIDTFTDKVFHGNPAAICLLSDWLNDELLQAIAVENNLSETAFIIENSAGYQIRWFTPKGEINLCGHATLAAGFLLFELGKTRANAVEFNSLSGSFQVRKNGDRFTLFFPRLHYEKLSKFHDLLQVLDKPFEDVFASEWDYLVLLEDEQAVSSAQINMKALLQLPKRGLILTAEASEADFYARCFYPKYHIPEDPVTGTAYCMLAPFWSERLGKRNLHAVQGSFRKGDVFCEVLDDQVCISGYCRWYLKGHLVI